MIPKLDNDLLLKIGAGAAAAWLLLSPYLPQVKAIASRLLKGLSTPSPQPSPEVGTVADMKTILEMADRLRRAGNTKAVDACQELIDLMLHGDG
jgi:hypothetical protein